MGTDSAFKLWCWKHRQTSAGYSKFSTDLYCGNRTETEHWLLQHHFPNLYSSGKLVACNYGKQIIQETLLTSRA